MALDTAYASVRRADVEDHQAVLDVLAVAFMTDPVACWAFPEAGERGRLQPRFYRSLLSHPAGEAYLVGRREGASVWLTLAAARRSLGSIRSLRGVRMHQRQARTRSSVRAARGPGL
ncbi:hypothetical protein AB0L53_59145 [Nonomuraea sp. NPDC052129]|uniref:hypothetical protein n=1 Tax=Nonomuraea sp. NPDC052129 TaxID=3154651 RepID=UPI0034289C30